jgi:hypothetical protein
VSESENAIAILNRLSDRGRHRTPDETDLLPTLAGLSASFSVRSSDWPKGPRALSVKVRQLAPQLRSIGIDVEFHREMNGRFVTVALAAEGDEFANVRGRTLIDARFGVFIDQENRAAG